MFNRIENPPTVENIITLYNSDFYNDLCDNFVKTTRAKLDDEYDIQLITQSITNDFLILNISFELINEEFKNNREQFLSFCVERYRYYEGYIDENPDGEFAKGEELEEWEKSEVIEEGELVRSFFLDIFCEFYLVKTGDNIRLLNFLKDTGMPYAKKHLKEICKIYKKSSS